MRVLVVEDEIKMASLIRRGLRGEGLAADVAIKGEDALWMAGSTDYDAIVLDVMLPGIDGFETCRRLREAGVWAPGADAHRARRDRRPRRRARRRRRRLPDQAVLVRRAARAPARARPPRPGRAPGGARGRRPAARPRRPARVARRHRGVAVGQGVPAARDVHAPPRRGALALPAARARLGLRLREPLEHRRRLRPLPARQDRPAVRPPHARDRPRRRLPARRLASPFS